MNKKYMHIVGYCAWLILGGNSRLQDFKRLQKTSQAFTTETSNFHKTSKDFQKLPKTSKDFQRLQETSKEFKRLHETSRDFMRLCELRETSQDFTDFTRLHETSRDFMRLHGTS
jgi:hypothetical protein